MNRFVKKYGVDAMGAMAVAIGYALKAQPLVLFSLVPVGLATNQLGGAGASVTLSPPPIPVLPLPVFPTLHVRMKIGLSRTFGS